MRYQTRSRRMEEVSAQGCGDGWGSPPPGNRHSRNRSRSSSRYRLRRSRSFRSRSLRCWKAVVEWKEEAGFFMSAKAEGEAREEA